MRSNSAPLRSFLHYCLEHSLSGRWTCGKSTSVTALESKGTSDILLGKDAAVGVVEGVQGWAEGSKRATEKWELPIPALETTQCVRMLKTVLHRDIASAPSLAGRHWLSCGAYIVKFFLCLAQACQLLLGKFKQESLIPLRVEVWRALQGVQTEGQSKHRGWTTVSLPEFWVEKNIKEDF